MSSLENAVPYSLCIERLPQRYRWQDLKDLTRKFTSTPGWTTVDELPDKTSSEIGWTKIMGRNAARDFYLYLSSNDFDGKPLIVHLFEETKNNAKLLNHNCNEVGMPCIHSTYNHNHQGPPCVPTLYNPSFAYTPPGILEPSIHSYTWCSPVMISCGIACPQFSAMLSSSLSDDSIYAYPVQQQKLELACNSNMKTNRNQSRGIFLRQLPFNVTAEELTRLLKDIGMPVNIEIPYRRRGTATIYFSTSEEALRAVNKYNGFEYKGLLLRVKLDWNGLPPRSTTESAKLLVNRSDPVIVNGSNLPP